MRTDLTLYDVSRMLKEAGFSQPELASGQHWYSKASIPTLIWAVNRNDGFGSQVVFVKHGHVENFPLPLDNRFRDFFYTYQPTIEDIMPKLPSFLALECDVDRETGEVTWAMVVRRESRILEGDLAWDPPPNIKHPVIACALAWLHFNSKPIGDGKVDIEE
jgi:hypothetical protein